MTDRTEAYPDEQAAAANAFSRAVAGDDDAARVQLFKIAYNIAYWVGAADDSERRHIASKLLQRVGPADEGTRSARPGLGLVDDPVLLANELLIIESSNRIVGGVTTDNFPDCVATGGDYQWCCSGTLIAAGVVVTAAHCLRDCSGSVFIGIDVSKPQEGHIVAVRETIMHPGYLATGRFDDLAVLLLAEPVEGVAPRAIASADNLSAARTVRLAGYGYTDFSATEGMGIRRMVDVGIAQPDAGYGARPETEFVAGAPLLDRDSCGGDSGGPAYIDAGGEWQLAGATSRPVPGHRKCGDGGIYTALPPYREWIESIAGPLG